MSKYIILEAIVALAIVVSAGRDREPRVRTTKELKFDSEDVPNDVSFTVTTEDPVSYSSINNLSFANLFPGEATRQGRSKQQLIIIPKSKTLMGLTMPKVYLTAGIATQTRIQQGGKGGGGGRPSGGGGGESGGGGSSGGGWGGGGGGSGGMGGGYGNQGGGGGMGGGYGNQGGGGGMSGGYGNQGGGGGGWGSQGGGGGNSGGGNGGWGGSGGNGGGGSGGGSWGFQGAGGGGGGGWGQQSMGGGGGGWGSGGGGGLGGGGWMTSQSGGGGGGWGGGGGSSGWEEESSECPDKKAQKAKKKAQKKKQKAKKKAQRKKKKSQKGGGGGGWGGWGSRGGNGGGGGGEGWDRFELGRQSNKKKVAWFPNNLLGEATRTDDTLVEDEEVWPDSPPRSSRVDMTAEAPAFHQFKSVRFPMLFNMDSLQSKESQEESGEEQNGEFVPNQSERSGTMSLTNADGSYEQVVMEIEDSDRSKENLPRTLSFKLVCQAPKPRFPKGRRVGERPEHNCVYVQVES